MCVYLSGGVHRSQGGRLDILKLELQVVTVTVT